MKKIDRNKVEIMEVKFNIIYRCFLHHRKRLTISRVFNTSDQITFTLKKKKR